MSENDNAEMLRDIAEILSDAEYIESLLDSEKRLMQAARLTERILKMHFPRRDREVESRGRSGQGLGPLIRSQRKRLSEAEFQRLSFAVDIRNRTSHHTSAGKPTDDQMSDAAKSL